MPTRISQSGRETDTHTATSNTRQEVAVREQRHREGMLMWGKEKVLPKRRVREAFMEKRSHLTWALKDGRKRGVGRRAFWAG